MVQTFARNFKKRLNGWLIASLTGAAVILLPVLYVFTSLFQAPNENWAQIREYMLADYALHSVWLVLLTGLFTAAIGVTLAWLVAAYDFPLRRFFRWALVLPLAVPPYIAAYTYSDMLSYTGIVQKTLRYQFGIVPDQRWFDVMSMKGAVFIFTMFLYPYVYMLARAFLERQSASYIENARLLGRRPAAVFFRVVLPLSRPALAGGLSLVVFEVLSDYGVTSYFGIPTISTAVFQTWFGMYDVESAMRLAGWLMVSVVGLFILERVLRGKRAFSSTTGKSRPLAPKRLRGIPALLAVLLCLLIWAWSFMVPILQMLVWASLTYRDVLNASFIELTGNTLYIALISTAIIVVFSVLTANVARTLPSSFSYVLSRLVTAGYSVPGAIIAIGVLALFIFLDGLLAPLYGLMGLGKAPLVLSMSLVMLTVGYVIRFTATGYNAVESGFEKIGMKYAEASRLLGCGMTKTFFKIELPLIRGAVWSGFILTFVEIVKELPLVLLLRPFNFETLATKAYQYAGDERIHEASVPALFIIGISLLSVYAVHHLGRRREP